MKINIERKKRFTARSGGYNVAYKVVRRFAFFPVRISNSQIAWFEWLYIVKEYNCRKNIWQDINDAYDSYEDKLFTDKKGYKQYKTHLRVTNHYPDSLHICRRHR